MGVENLESAHNQDEETRDVEPMADPDRQFVAVDPLDNRG
jgi:hypothetical protein